MSSMLRRPGVTAVSLGAVLATVLSSTRAGGQEVGPRLEMVSATLERTSTAHTPSFPKGTKKIYVVYMVAGVKDETTVKGTWTAEKVEGVGPNTQITVSQAKAPEGRTMGSFSYILPNGWPPGDYRVEVVCGKSDKTIKFKVEK